MSSELTATFGLALLVAFDNLRVAVPLGGAVTTAERRRLATSFAMCEAAMPIVGVAIGAQAARLLEHPATYLGAALLGVAALLVLRTSERERSRRGPLLVTLPLALSLDNLAAGAALGALGSDVVAAALVVGSVSGLVAFVGLEVGASLKRLLPRHLEPVCACALGIAAVTTLVQT